ncbi:hypothetical protein, partial [Agaribacter marinus]|uniref:hypothetical protein n=1 Tax=Agaribacter marinus TaxID=1431249 RepID=UPI0024E0E81A
MVAVVASEGAGLFNSSLSLIGREGAYGQAGLGQGNERVFVNAATGSLVIQGQDNGIANLGVDVAGLRTYNSIGSIDDANGDDHWRLGFLSRINGSAGSVSVKRITADGAEQHFVRQSNVGGVITYSSSDGAGAHDKLTYENNGWMFEEGSSLVRLHYDNTGKQVAALDRQGHGHRYEYEGTKLVRIVSDVVNNAGTVTQETAVLEYDSNSTGNARITAIRFGTVDSDGDTQEIRRQYYKYDEHGRLEAVSIDLTPDDNNIDDKKVFATTYTYKDSTSQRIASLAQSDGTGLTFHYYENGHAHAGKISQIIDGESGTTNYYYEANAFGGLDTDVTVAGRTTTFSSDGDMRLRSMTSMIDSQEITTSYTYTADGDIETVSRGAGQLITFAYENGNQISQVNAEGDTVERRYNSKNQLIEESLHLQQIGEPDSIISTFYIYDNDSNLRFTISPENRVTQFDYNDLGQLEQEFSYHRDAYSAALVAGSEPSLDDLTTWRASLSTFGKYDVSTVDYTYDFRGQIATKTEYEEVTPSGEGNPSMAQTTYYHYDMMGRLLSETSPELRQKAYAYDGLNRVLAEYDTVIVTQGSTNGSPNVESRVELITHNYEDSAMRISTTQHNGLVTTNTFDAAGRLSSTQTGIANDLASFAEQRFYFDAQGRQIATQHSNGAKSYTIYDDAGRRAFSIDRAGVVTAYEYSDTNQLTFATTYAKDIVITGAWLNAEDDFAVNNDDKPLALIDVENMISEAGRDASADRSIRYIYDDAGRQTFQIDAEGSVTEFRYDSAGRRTHAIAYDVTVDITQTSLPTMVVNSNTRIQRTFYTDDGLMLATVDAEGYATEYFYDNGGRQIKSTSYASQSTAYTGLAFNITLQINGAWSDLKPALNTDSKLAIGADRSSYTIYNSLGQIAASITPEGQLTAIEYYPDGQVQSSRVYAELKRNYSGGLLTLPTSNDEDQISIYTYNARGQVATETQQPQGLVTSYIYNDQAYLIGVTRNPGVSDEIRTNWFKKDLLDREVGVLNGRVSSSSAFTSFLEDDISNAALETAISNNVGNGTRSAIDSKGRVTSTTDAEGHSTYYFYDDREQLTATITDDGEVTENIYNNFGELKQTIVYTKRLPLSALPNLLGGDLESSLQSIIESIHTDDDIQTDFTYTKRGNLDVLHTSKRSGDISNGQHVDNDYNRFGQLAYTHTRLSSDNVRTDKFTYDNRGLRTSATVDFDNNPATQGAAANATTTTQYDAFGRVISQTDANNNDTVYQYNDKVTRGTEVTLTYQSQFGAVSNITTYDILGRTVEVKSGVSGGNAAHTQSYKYNGQNRTQWIDSGDGTGTLLIFNGFGELTDTQTGRLENDGSLSELTSHTHLEYDKDGNNVTRVEGYGSDAAVSTTYVYSANNRLERMSTSGIDGTHQYFYDNVGNVITSINPEGHKTRFVYDAAGQLIYTLNNAGTLSKSTYDVNGNKTSETVYKQTFSSSDFDDVSPIRPEAMASRIADANATIGAQQHYIYDANNRLIASIDPVGAVTVNSYDRRGLVTAQVKYANPSTISNADKQRIAKGEVSSNGIAGLLPFANNSKDMQTASVYDDNGRVVYSLQRLANGQAQVKQNRYDATGQLIQTRAMANTIAYDTNYSRGDLAALYHLDVDGIPKVNKNDPNDRVSHFVYDSAGRLSFTVDSEGAVTRTEYDAAGRVFKTTAYATPVQTGATEFSFSQLSNRVFTNASTKDRTTETTYDAAGRVETVTQLLAGSADNIVEHWEYNNAGQKIRYTNGNNDVWHYAYDDAGRLSFEFTPVIKDVQVQNGNTLTAYPEARQVTAISYDDLGNVTSRTMGVVRVGVGAASSSLVVANGKELDSGHIAALSNASIQQAQTTTFTYDELGRQISVSEPTLAVDSEAPNVTSHTRYNALGQAYINQIIVTDSSDSPKTLSTINSYKVYDAGGRVAFDVDAEGYVTAYEYDAQGNQTSLTRYEKQLTMTLRNKDAEISIEQIETWLSSLDSTESKSRTVNTEYNTLGQVVGVKQPLVTYGEVNAQGAVTQGSARPETIYIYNVFGEVTLQREKINSSSFADTRYFYDELGNQIYMVDSENYVTQYAYNAFGQVTNMLEDAGPVVNSDLAGKVIESSAFPDSFAENDRVWAYEYDTLGRKVKDIQTNLRYHALSTDAEDINVNTATKLTTDSEVVTEYDNAGNIVSVDNNGRVSVNAYDSIGRLARTTQQAASVVTDVKALRNDLHQGTTSLITSYQYDVHGNTIRTLQGAGNAHTLLSENDTDVRVTTQLFNARNQVLKQIDAEGASTTFKYDYQGNIIEQARQFVNPSTTYDYDLKATLYTDYQGEHDYTLRTQFTLPATVTFDSSSGVLQGALAGHSIPDGSYLVITVEVADEHGIEVASLSTGLTHTSSTIDIHETIPNWQYAPAPATNEHAVTAYMYDALGQVKETTLSHLANDKHTVQTKLVSKYNSFGEITNQGDPQFNGESNAAPQVYFKYDNAGRLESTNEGDGATKTYLYDLRGNVVRSSHAGRGDTLNVLDKLGRVEKQFLASFVAKRAGDGLSARVTPVVRQQYDRWGNVVQVTNANGYTTTYSYNHNNQITNETRHLVVVADDDGSSEVKAPEFNNYYDIYNQLIARKDANNGLRVNKYDARGNLTQTKDEVGHSTHLGYNVFGEHIATRDAIGYISTTKVDKLGRVIETGDIRAPEDGSALTYQRLNSFIFNELGYKTQFTNALDHQYHYENDIRGNVTKTHSPENVVMSYAYNRQGQQTVESYDRLRINAATSGKLNQIENTYNYFGQQIQKSDLSDNEYIFTHENGLLEERTINFKLAGVKNQTVDYEYYDNGLLKSVEDSSTTSRSDFEYDIAGQLVSETRKTVNSLQQTLIERTDTTYDAHGRATQVLVTDINVNDQTQEKIRSALRYTYDAMGNRRSVEVFNGYSGTIDADKAPSINPDFQGLSYTPATTGEEYNYEIGKLKDIFIDEQIDDLEYELLLKQGNEYVVVDDNLSSNPATFGGHWLQLILDTDGDGDNVLHIHAQEAQVGDHHYAIRAKQPEKTELFTLLPFFLPVRDDLKPRFSDPEIRFGEVPELLPGTTYEKEFNLIEFIQDPEGKQLNFNVVAEPLASLPDWLELDISNIDSGIATIKTKEGEVVPVNFSSDVTFKVIANDGTTSNQFILTISASVDVNVAPEPIPDKNYRLGMLLGETVRNFPLFNYFQDDEDVSKLIYSIYDFGDADDGTISIVEGNRLSYRPTNQEAHEVTVKVIATDNEGDGLPSVPVSFTFYFPGVKAQQPISVKQSSGRATLSPNSFVHAFEVPDYFNHSDGASFEVSNITIDGRSAPLGPFNASVVNPGGGAPRLVYFGFSRPAVGPSTAISVGFTVTGTGAGGSTAEVDFTITKKSTPIAKSGSKVFSVSEGNTFSISKENLLRRFTDNDGDSIASVEFSGLSPYLEANAGGLRSIGALPLSADGFTFTLRAVDENGSKSSPVVFTLEVAQQPISVKQSSGSATLSPNSFVHAFEVPDYFNHS